jgi:hypothetical protein
MTKSPVTCWNAGRFIGVTVRGRRTSQTVDETMLPRRRANKSQPSRCDIFPTGRVVGTRGVGRWERGREQKRERESC